MLISGLESFIDGEDVPSTEGIRELLRRQKTALSVLAGVAPPLAGGAIGGSPGAAVASGAATALASGAVMFVADKIANKGRVEGSVAEVEEMMVRVRSAMNIIRIAADAVYAQDLSHTAEAAGGVEAKIKGDLEKIGLKTETNKRGVLVIKSTSREAYRGPIPKMIPFNESGWTPEKLKSLTEQASKLGIESGSICAALNKKLAETYDVENPTTIPAAVDFIYDALDCASTEATFDLRYVRRSLVSARKFFTDKKPEESSES